MQLLTFEGSGLIRPLSECSRQHNNKCNDCTFGEAASERPAKTANEADAAAMGSFIWSGAKKMESQYLPRSWAASSI